MNIALVGAGNLATNIGKAFVRARHSVVQVFSRTESSARDLASALGCSYTVSVEDVVDDADL